MGRLFQCDPSLRSGGPGLGAESKEEKSGEKRRNTDGGTQGATQLIHGANRGDVCKEDPKVLQVENDRNFTLKKPPKQLPKQKCS